MNLIVSNHISSLSPRVTGRGTEIESSLSPPACKTLAKVGVPWLDGKILSMLAANIKNNKIFKYL